MSRASSTAAEATDAQVVAANEASIQAFHLAMLVGAGLLAIGSAVSFVGLRESHGRAPSQAPASIATATESSDG